MRAVPCEFFAEDFTLQRCVASDYVLPPSLPGGELTAVCVLNRPETWQALCVDGNEEDRCSRMELYANYLDSVETHLLQEIAARSSHFFEAAGVVQDLRASLTRTFQQVAGLHQQACSAAHCADRVIFMHD